jgi:hypothetical protein
VGKTRSQETARLNSAVDRSTVPIVCVKNVKHKPFASPNPTYNFVQTENLPVKNLGSSPI